MANIFDRFDEAPAAVTPTAPAPRPDVQAAPVAASSNPFDQFDPPAPVAAKPKEDMLGQLGAGIVKGFPNAGIGLIDASEVGRRMGVNLPGMDILTGMAASTVKPMLPKDWQDRIPEPRTGAAIKEAMSAARVNPDDYFRAPETPGERIAEMAGEGLITSVVSPNKAQGWGKLAQLAKELAIGTTAGAGSQAAMEVAPDWLDPLAGIVGGFAGGAGGMGVVEAPGMIGKGLKGAGNYVAPAFANAAGREKLAGARLAETVGDRDAAIAAIDNSGEIVPGSKPTAFQATGNVNVGSLERALARSDDEFKAKLLERVQQQNEARVQALDTIQESGNPALVADFFRGRMRELEGMASDLYEVAEKQAKGAYEGMGERPAAEVGSQAREAIETQYRALNAETNRLWESIDPTGTLKVVTEPLVRNTAKIYGNMSPEEMMSLSAREQKIAEIIGNYGETLPFKRFKDLRSEISAAMRESKMTGQLTSYGRLSRLRNAIEEAVSDSIAGKMHSDPSLATDFVTKAREWYENRVSGEPTPVERPAAARASADEPYIAAPARPGAAAGAVDNPTAAARGVSEQPGAVGAQERVAAAPESNQGLPEDGSQPVARSAEGIQGLDPQEVGVDARRFQFKEGGDQQGVTERLQGVERWDPRLAGTALVFRDSAGKDWVADGHQRFGLARRLMDNGHPPIKVNSFVLDAADGYSDAQVRAIAAVKNIAEGTGSPIDAAKVLRAAKESGVDLPPLPPRSSLVRDGRALAELSPEAFGMVVNEVVPHTYGALVGRLVKDPLQQEEAVRLLAKLKPDNIRQAELVIRDMLASGTEQMTRQGGLFGAEAFADSVTLERAKIADAALQQLKQDKRTFSTLVNEADRIETQGNVLSKGANEARLSTDEKAADLLTKLAFRSGPVSDALTRLARSFKAGDIPANAAARDFLGTVRDAIERGVDEGADVGSIGARQAADAGEELATPRDPDTAEMFQPDKFGGFDTEPGIQGKPQTLIPGVAPIDDAARMAADAKRGLKGGDAPLPKGGLFDEDSREFNDKQMSLFQNGDATPITKTMADRFFNAGRSAEEAVAAGQLVDAFYTTMAQRLGKTVDDVQKKFPLPEVRKGGDNPSDVPLFQPAWHGSPHIFDKFSTDKIGTGEGNQAYGHGLYLSSDKEVAKWYREGLAPIVQVDARGVERPIPDSGPVNYAARSIRDAGMVERPNGVTPIDHAIAGLKEQVADPSNTDAGKKLYGDALEIAEQWKADGVKLKTGGRLYRVEVPEHHELLDWDKPFNEQSPSVQEKLKSIGVEPPQPPSPIKDVQLRSIINRAIRANDGNVDGSEIEMIIDNDQALYNMAERLAKRDAPDILEEYGPGRAIRWMARDWLDKSEAVKKFTGEDIYKQLGAKITGQPDRITLDSGASQDRAASAELRKIGIPGHQYVGHESGKTNYVVYDDSKVNITEYEQGPRGSIKFDPTGGASLINLFEKADASTALHEAGHQFLHMFRQFASAADAPETLVKDWSAAKAWWEKNAKDVATDAGEGVTAADVRKVLRDQTTGDRLKDLAIDRGLHEQWARGFEVYLREGKAPNAAMRGVFEQFKNWLSQVYQSITGMGVNLSPEIKGVFDRMLGGEGGTLVDEAAAGRFKAATAATRNLKETFGTKPVKSILRRPGPTYPYDMTPEAVSSQLFKPGPEGAANITNILKAAGNAPAAKEAVEAAAILSAKRSATKDGVIDPAKFEAWRARHSDALAAAPDVERKLSSAASLSKEMVRMGEMKAKALDAVRRSAIGKLLNVDASGDVSSTVGNMLGRADSVRAMRDLAAQASADPQALEGLRRALVDHMIGRLKTPKDTLRADTFQRFLGKNAPALSQVLTPEQMNGLRAIAQDLKRASKDVRAPGGGSDTAENLAARNRYVHESPTILGTIARQAVGGIAGGVAAHFLLGGPFGAAVGWAAQTLGGTVLQSMRTAGIERIDQLIKEAILDPELMKALLMKAPKQKNTGSALVLAQRLGNLAANNLAISASQNANERREPAKAGAGK